MALLALTDAVLAASQQLATTATLNGVAFDGVNGVAVGDAGIVFTTGDDGRTWVRRTVPTTVDLFAVALDRSLCTGAGCIWAAGAAGVLLFSGDGGQTWCEQRTGSTESLFAVRVTTELVAVGADSTIVRSRDPRTCTAGYSTVRLPSSPETGQTSLYDVDYANDWYVVGSTGALLVMDDAGTVTRLDSGVSGDLYGVGAATAPVTTAEARACGCTQFLRVVAVGAGGTVVTGGGATPIGGPPARVTSMTPAASGTARTLRDVTVLRGLFSEFRTFAVGDDGTVVTDSADEGMLGPRSSGTCADLLAVDGRGADDHGRFAVIAAGHGGVLLSDLDSVQAGLTNCQDAPQGAGYRIVAADGGIFTFGVRRYHGSTGDLRLNRPIVAGAAEQTTFDGYWLVADDGGVFAFNAGFFGSLGGQRLSSPAVSIKSTPSAKGYWIALADGEVRFFGDAGSFGDLSRRPPAHRIVDLAATPSGQGYWLVAEDGGVFAFGDAGFYGSLGGRSLNASIVDIAPAFDNEGYYLVARDGGVFAFGSATFKGSTGGSNLKSPIVAILVSPDGRGYWLAGADGGIFAFGVGFAGSAAGRRLNAPAIDLID